MPPHDYSEDQLVEQPAIRLFAELGWATVVAMERPDGLLIEWTQADFFKLRQVNGFLFE